MIRDERGGHACRARAEYQQVYFLVPVLMHRTHVHVSFMSFRRACGFDARRKMSR
ncbi:hypothetical protein [Burkholderia sp. LMG 13014]|uniref:hypothetical protein n=1 Tax=Burkholderia sp. LMG 13014 TaxID=2709306 RepID=UPI001F06CEA0|nr:hypothetical protein [Burkholderia sp. LMG 13014]